jgi:hypothetical protein
LALFAWAIIAVVIVMQAIPFTEGYRRAADEVMFLDHWIQGWHAVMEHARSAAHYQGRLGFRVIMPLNALAADLSDMLAARAAFVLLHFAILVLFAFYFSLISATNATKALLLLLVTLQPVCRPVEFMPPVTYPLQNSLPFLVLLLARCVVVCESRRDDGGRASRLWPAYIVFTLAMLTTEFAFLLGTSLLFAEHGFVFVAQARQGIPRRDRLARLIREPIARYDALSVGFFLVAYLSWRATHPSSYEGNVLDGAFEIGRVLATTFHRVWAGTIFSHDLIPPLSAARGLWLAAAIVGIATSCGLVLSLPAIRSLPSPLVVAAGAIVAILYISFPLAANARQQHWCLVDGACAYLDSRLSYLAAVVIVLCALAWALRSLARPILAEAFVVSVSVILGVIAALTFMDSWQRGRTMHADAAAWRNAALLACYPDHQPVSDDLLLRMIDGEKRVTFHPHVDRPAFWRRYLSYTAGSRDCSAPGEAASSRLAQLSHLGPVIRPGQTIDFAAGKGIATYLGTGWSQPEPPFGIWSDGPQANLVFVPKGVPAGSQAYLRIRFYPYFGPSVANQTIDVFVNGVPTEKWTLTMDRDRLGCCERFVALPRTAAQDGMVIVEFRMSQPRTPSLEPGSPEARRLGIALLMVTMTDARPPQ